MTVGTQLLVGVFGVNAQANVGLGRLNKLGGSRFFEQF
jgi:hypothetical protein